MSNQSHVLVSELNLERQRWQIVLPILKEFAQQNQIGFLHKKFGVDTVQFDKILITVLFDLINLEQVMSAADTCSRLGKKLYVITDSWVDHEKFQHPNLIVFSMPELLSLTALTDNVPPVGKPSKLYNAFIHRTESVRQSWFYFLYLRNLFDKGYISYKLYQINTTLTGRELFDKIHVDYLSAVPHFNQAYEVLKELIPYSNFVDREDLSELILDTKYSLVLDTYATEDDVGSYYISEKVTRALQYPTVSLPFLQRGTLQKLSNSGLYINPTMLTFDQLDWRERQQQILNILENDLINISDQDLYRQAQHNRSVFSSWLTRCLTQDFFSQVFDTIVSD